MTARTKNSSSKINRKWMSNAQTSVLLPDDNFSLHKRYNDPNENKQGLNRWENQTASTNSIRNLITQTVNVLSVSSGFVRMLQTFFVRVNSCQTYRSTTLLAVNLRFITFLTPILSQTHTFPLCILLTTLEHTV